MSTLLRRDGLLFSLLLVLLLRWWWWWCEQHFLFFSGHLFFYTGFTSGFHRTLNPQKRLYTAARTMTEGQSK